ncbi:MAG: CoA pyrophosphatase [Frankiaceae bacterium]|nr:CoA pyrophosphatase [Frankiaceae bacterium]
MSIPPWLQALADALPHVRPEQLSRFLPPAEGGRHSAVLVLFGDGARGPDLLFIERAATLRSHAGQPAFPGGVQDDSDAGPVEAALREAQEEVGLDPTGVEILGTLPDLWLPPSGFVVTPVVGWWRDPHDVGVVDHAEVAAVARVPLAELVDPANRLSVSHPSGWIGPAFDVGDMRVWGFTAGLTDRLLELGGWAVPWDRTRVRELDPETAALALRTAGGPTA